MAWTGFLTKCIAAVRDSTDEPSVSAKWTDAKIIPYIENAYAEVFNEINRGQEEPITAEFDVTSTTQTADEDYGLPPNISSIMKMEIRNSNDDPVANIRSRSMWNPYGQGISVMGNLLRIKEGALTVDSKVRLYYIPSGTARLHSGTGTTNVGSGTETADAASTTTTIVVAGSDVTADYPAGAWVYHPTDAEWVQITSSAFSTNTTVTMSSTSTAWDGETVQAFYRDRITLAASPTTGTLDTRKQAYAGSIVRILGCSNSYSDYVQDRVISSYDHVTRIATLIADFDIPPSGTITYEIGPFLDTVLDQAISTYVAMQIVGIEGDGRRYKTLQAIYGSKIRNLRLNFGNYHSYSTRIFRGDTPQNPLYAG